MAAAGRRSPPGSWLPDDEHVCMNASSAALTGALVPFGADKITDRHLSVIGSVRKEARTTTVFSMACSSARPWSETWGSIRMNGADAVVDCDAGIDVVTGLSLGAMSQTGPWNRFVVDGGG